MIREQLWGVRVEKSEKSCKFKLFSYAVKSAALPDVPLSRDPSWVHLVLPPVCSFLCGEGGFFCLFFKYIHFFNQHSQSVSFPHQMIFSSCICAFRKKCMVLFSSIFYEKFCLQMHLLGSQAHSRVKSGPLPQSHSLLQIHANLQSSVIWAKTYVNCYVRGVESASD